MDLKLFHTKLSTQVHMIIFRAEVKLLPSTSSYTLSLIHHVVMMVLMSLFRMRKSQPQRVTTLKYMLGVLWEQCNLLVSSCGDLGFRSCLNSLRIPHP